jgi:hypothetical protein
VEHCWNEPSPILVMLEVAVKVTLVRFPHSLNVSTPVFVSPFPMVAVVRLVQFLNADCPIVVTLFGIVMLVRPELLNA